MGGEEGERTSWFWLMSEYCAHARAHAYTHVHAHTHAHTHTHTIHLPTNPPTQALGGKPHYMDGDVDSKPVTFTAESLREV